MPTMTQEGSIFILKITISNVNTSILKSCIKYYYKVIKFNHLHSSNMDALNSLNVVLIHQKQNIQNIFFNLILI
jgi:hypothetical protein